MAQFGEVRVDFITFTTGVSPSEANVTIPVSGLVKNPTFSGDITVTGTISGATITGDTGQFTTLTATTANVTSGIFASGTAAAPSVSVGTTDNGIYSPAANQIAITTSGAHQVRVTAGGNVGIGTVAPTQRLVVSDTDTTVASFDTNQTTTRLRLRTGLSSDVYVGAVDTNAFFVNTDGTERLRITSSGDVGIGTTSPFSALDVFYSGSGTSVASSGSTDATTGTRIGRGSVGIDFGILDNGTSYLQNRNISDFATNYNFIINPNGGNVGIGTTSPAVKLHVDGGNNVNNLLVTSTNNASYITFADTNTTSNSQVRVGSSGDGMRIFTGGTDSMRIDSVGNVGIGTSSPTERLSVIGTDSGLYLSSTGSPTTGYHFRRESSDGYLYITGNQQSFSGYYFQLYPNGGSANTTAMAIDNSGNVGIATSSPSATLDVNGSLAKTSGSFKIDHPLPALSKTHHLVHSFVEAPDASNLYAGMVDLVDGTATVNIDTAHRMTEGTFEALNTLQSWSSSNESGYAPVKCSVSGNLLTIECEDATSTDTVYYEVRGIRKDQHMLDTEWTDENGRVITEPLKQPLTDAGL